MRIRSVCLFVVMVAVTGCDSTPEVAIDSPAPADTVAEAVAIAVAARANDMECQELLIALPGGDLRISWDGNGPVYMEGPVTQVYTGTWPD